MTCCVHINIVVSDILSERQSLASVVLRTTNCSPPLGHPRGSSTLKYVDSGPLSRFRRLLSYTRVSNYDEFVFELDDCS